MVPQKLLFKLAFNNLPLFPKQTLGALHDTYKNISGDHLMPEQYQRNFWD